MFLYSTILNILEQIFFKLSYRQTSALGLWLGFSSSDMCKHDLIPQTPLYDLVSNPSGTVHMQNQIIVKCLPHLDL